MGAKIIRIYDRPLIPMGTMVLRATSVLIFISESLRPAKKRNREM